MRKKQQNFLINLDKINSCDDDNDDFINLKNNINK